MEKIFTATNEILFLTLSESLQTSSQGRLPRHVHVECIFFVASMKKLGKVVKSNDQQTALPVLLVFLTGDQIYHQQHVSTCLESNQAHLLIHNSDIGMTKNKKGHKNG